MKLLTPKNTIFAIIMAALLMTNYMAGAVTLDGINDLITSKKIGGVVYADQYVSIQDAIDATTHKIIINGTIAMPIIISNRHHLDIEIDSLSYIGSDDINMIMFNIDDSSDISIHGGFISGNQKSQEIMDLNYVDGFNIYNINMTDTRQMGAYINLWNSENGHIYSNIITGNNSGLGINILDGSHNIELSGNIYKNTYDSAVSIGSTGAGILVSNITVTGDILNRDNKMFGNSMGFSVFGKAQDIKFSNVISNGNGLDGFNCITDVFIPNSIHFDNVQSYNNNRNGITIQCTNATVTGGEIKYNNEHGIAIQENGSLIIGVSSLSNTKHGIMTDVNVRNTSISDSYSKYNTWRAIGESSGSTDNKYVENDFQNNLLATSYAAGSTSVHYNNKGDSPFNHGNSAAAPNAFDAGDTYYDTDLNNLCISSAAGAASWLEVKDMTTACT